MSDDLLLYTHPRSRGRTVRWMPEEVGRPYVARPLRYGDEMKAAGFIAVNPMGKVPAIVHAGRVVTEVAAICAYLADAFPRAGLAPPMADRAEYYRWMFFASGPMEAAVTNGILGVAVAPERRGMVGYGSLDAVLDAAESAVADREYVAGPRFTAADVVLGAQLAFGKMFGVVTNRPAFAAYVDRLSARPAAMRARAADDALLPDFPPRGA